MQVGWAQPRRPAPRGGAALAGLLALLLLAACHGPTLSHRLGLTSRVPRETPPEPAPPAEGPGAPGRTPTAGGGVRGTPPGGRQVRLRPEDLAPVDAWIDHRRNPQWILGDEVEVVASTEYFAQALTLNREGFSGLVERRDDRQGDDTVVTLRFLGDESQMSAMSNPRVLIGTGLTVTARRLLILRLRRTRDTRQPVLLRVTANGRAARGRHETVLERAPMLRVGGTLRWVDGAWRWMPLGS